MMMTIIIQSIIVVTEMIMMKMAHTTQISQTSTVMIEIKWLPAQNTEQVSFLFLTTVLTTVE